MTVDFRDNLRDMEALAGVFVTKRVTKGEVQDGGTGLLGLWQDAAEFARAPSGLPRPRAAIALGSPRNPPGPGLLGLLDRAGHAVVATPRSDPPAPIPAQRSPNWLPSPSWSTLVMYQKLPPQLARRSNARPRAPLNQLSRNPSRILRCWKRAL